MTDRRPILLAAGGTGGHLFPAEALAGELIRRGAEIELVTDARVAAHARDFPARAVHAVASATIGGRSPRAVARLAGGLGYGFGQSLRLMRTVRPRAVVGFGGYPTVPPLAAAELLGIPAVIHEQNGVMGRANRLLAPRATAIATGFAKLDKVSARIAAKAVHVGNPVRPAVLAAASPYEPPAGGSPIRLLVFGGSQGARVMSEAVPAALAALDAALRARLRVVHQARAEDTETALTGYAAARIEADIAPFFRDLPMRMAAAHLVIARAGASTVAELAAIGRPAVLVPLPNSLDQDQLANARALAAAGGATVMVQAELTAASLSGLLARLLTAPAALAAQAAASRAFAVPDAAARLADLVLGVARPAGAEP
ncbi:MAG TPA: undecaprenyldiphospho-muramoylpentapeptide beta-N-acetylglucosaminyltransferase [Hyphomicrobiales bacterium]|nr:undecaprenyldiphospho-muramoylpentapeptide beta-N-acetylglucosaminyltransferase [Hyphomicrobiales bacterium]